VRFLPTPPATALRRALLLGVTGVSLYLLAPSLLAVFSSAGRLDQVRPLWFLPMVALEAASLISMALLQRLCLGPGAVVPVLWSQLAGNAFARVVPGGGAAGAALQYSMLVEAGEAGGRAATALTAANLLTFATLLALPALTLPAILAGLPVEAGLAEAALLGFGGFVVMAAAGAALLALDGPLAFVGRAVQRLRNRVLRRRPPLVDLPARLLEERDLILRTVGARWWEALLASLARWLLDYGVLLTALAAVGATPSPSLVLLAYTASQTLAQIPVTPGGLGFVEAGLLGLLALAGVSGGRAALATLAYRLVSFWLPLPAGGVAIALHKRRHAGGAAR
jgi:uncharacterized membrane protein YbhN (UPF0104 family)